MKSQSIITTKSYAQILKMSAHSRCPGNAKRARREQRTMPKKNVEISRGMDGMLKKNSPGARVT